jgi:hypothetical protein
MPSKPAKPAKQTKPVKTEALNRHVREGRDAARRKLIADELKTAKDVSNNEWKRLEAINRLARRLRDSMRENEKAWAAFDTERDTRKTLEGELHKASTELAAEKLARAEATEEWNKTMLELRDLRTRFATVTTGAPGSPIAPPNPTGAPAPAEDKLTMRPELLAQMDREHAAGDAEPSHYDIWLDEARHAAETLEDAIRNAENVAAAEPETPCGQDHRQLAAWLTELRAISLSKKTGRAFTLTWDPASETWTTKQVYDTDSEEFRMMEYDLEVERARHEETIEEFRMMEHDLEVERARHEETIQALHRVNAEGSGAFTALEESRANHFRCIERLEKLQATETALVEMLDAEKEAHKQTAETLAKTASESLKHLAYIDSLNARLERYAKWVDAWRARLARTKAALKDIAGMPEYDQDDHCRMRARAKNAIAEDDSYSRQSFTNSIAAAPAPSKPSESSEQAVSAVAAIMGNLMVRAATLCLMTRDLKLCVFVLARAQNVPTIYDFDLRRWIGYFHDDEAKTVAMIANSNQP